MRLLLCTALAAAAHAGSSVCETDRETDATERALAFAGALTPQTIKVKLVNYGEASASRLAELATIVEDTLDALTPPNSINTVTTESKSPTSHTPGTDCDALIPDSSDTTVEHIHIFDPEFNSDNCDYNFAGVANFKGHDAATIEDASNGLFQHLVMHELAHLLNVNHATSYSEEYGDPTDAVGARRMLKPGASISTLGAGSLAILQWLTLLDSAKTEKVPELGLTNQAVRLTPGLILSYRGTKGHDAALLGKYQRQCYLHTIATETPGGDHLHSTLIAGPFTTRGTTVGHISVYCTPQAEGALFSVRQGASPVGYIPDAWPSWIATFIWADFVVLGLGFAYIS